MDEPGGTPAAAIDSTLITGMMVSKTRQKNCDGCVRIKRRCDRRTPTCSRCVERRIPCMYTKTRVKESTTAGSTPATAAAVVPAGGQVDLLAADYVDDDGGSFLDSPFDIMDLINHDPSPSTTMLPQCLTFPPPLQDFSLTTTTTTTPPQRPGTPVDEATASAYEHMALLCSPAAAHPWHLHDPATTAHFLLQRVEAFASDMALRGATPYCHAELYSRQPAPRAVLACIGVAALYVGGRAGGGNMAMVVQAVQSGARELVRDGGGGGGEEGVGVVLSPLERLARTQALLLYQVMRLFDGDIGLRAQAERDTAVLLAWLEDLRRIRDNLSPSDSSVSAMRRSSGGGGGGGGDDEGVTAAPPPSRQTWIFAESVRRTVVMAYTVIGMYALLKDSEAPSREELEPWGYMHRWTMGRGLWEARSAGEFGRRWREGGGGFVVANHDLGGFVRGGTRGRGEVDEFGRIMLCLYVGVEAMEEFLAGE